ncbi:MAG: hypothetical protein AAFX50_09190, partial [Acidobacteriota bacterium]
MPTPPTARPSEAPTASPKRTSGARFVAGDHRELQGAHADLIVGGKIPRFLHLGTGHADVPG